MLLFGRRNYRIIKIRSGESDRRGPTGCIIIVAAQWMNERPILEAVCATACQKDSHNFSLENVSRRIWGCFWHLQQTRTVMIENKF
jgi:hypothetical protein